MLCKEQENPEYGEDLVRQIEAFVQSIDVKTSLDRQFVNTLSRAVEEIRNETRQRFSKLADEISRDSLVRLAMDR